MKNTYSLRERVLALFLSVILVFGLLPSNIVFAADDSVLSTNIGTLTFTVGETQEFTFSTTANDDAGIMVIGSFDFSEPSAIEKLEYLESKDGTWHEFYGDFGLYAGFPMIDGTSTFRVTFNKAGSYTVTASMKKVEDGSVLCTTTANVVVNGITQTGFVFAEPEPAACAITDNLTYTNTASGGEGTGEVSYEIVSGSEIATIDKNTGKLSIAKYGTVAVKATKAGDDRYAEATATYTLVVNGIGQTGFAFETTSPDALTIKDNLTYTNTASGGDGIGEVSYEIVSGSEIATIDKNTGKLSIAKYGTVAVKATKAGDDRYADATATYTLVVNGIEQSGFAFATASPDAIVYGDNNNKYTNSVVNAVGEGELVYEIVSGHDVATIDAATGELTILKAGTVTVKATKAGDNRYVTATDTYALTINPASQTGFAFENATPDNLTYSEELTYTNVANGGPGGGAITYEITAGSDVATINATTGQLMILKAGTVTVKATKAADDKYAEVTATYYLSIDMAEQINFEFENATPDNLTYSEGLTYTNVAFGGLGEGAITYEITAGSDVATIDSATGEVTILKAGTVIVKATKAADGKYALISATYSLTVDKATQTDIGFENATPVVTYGDNGNKYTNTLKNAMGEGAITYEITAGSDVATIDSATGEVTILKAGTVIVKASKETDDCYLVAEATYTLNINRANQTISFVNNSVNETYGISTYTNSVVSSEPHGTGALTYEIVGENTIGATIDSATGKLTFGNSEGRVGTITVKVTRAEDDCYNSCFGEFTFTLDYEKTPATPYTLSGNTANASGWYTGDVTIKAPDGYLISYFNELSTTDWAESVIYSSEGTNTFVVYLLNEKSNTITDAITVKELKIDKTKPINLEIRYKDPALKTILDQLFFISQKDVVVEFSAEDTVSGVAKVEYSTNGGVNYTEVKPENGKYSITVKAEFRNEIVLKITDVAGNVITTLDDENTDNNNRVLVVDHDPPVIEYKLNGEYSEKDGIIHTKDDVFSITFNVTDNNYDLRAANPVVKVNGTAQNLSWNSGKTSGAAILELPNEGHYDITVDFTDRSGNAAEQYSATVYVDKTAPAVNITYSETNLKDRVVDDPDTISTENISRQTTDPATANTRFVYNGDIVASVTIQEVNFYAEDIVILVDGTEVKPDSEWKNVGTNQYETNITITSEGDHVITVGEYKDRAGNAMSWYSAEYENKTGTGTYTSNTLTNDKTAPSIKVEYDNISVVNEKYYDADRTATVRITDRDFRPNEVVLTIVDVNAANKDTAYTAPDITTWAAWTYVGDNTWQAKIPFNADANYKVSLAYTDIAKIKAKTYTTEFAVDKVNPQALSIEYSDGYANIFEEIIDKVTFGVFYYGSATEVKLTATDVTSGMEYIVLNAAQSGSNGATTIKLPVDLVISADGKILSGTQGNVNNIKVKNVDGVMTVTFTVPKEFRGEFTFEAVDMAKRSTSEDDSNIIVVDAIAPTRTVSYEPTKIVSIADMKDVDAVAEGDSVVMYYNTDAVATIRVKEANFYANEITIMVNGTAVATDNGWVNIKGENDEVTDIWEATVTIADEGDYVLTMTYTDRSKNEMVKYESQRIVIDKTAPIVKVSYGNTNIKNTIDGRDYFDAVQTATITVTEHNFRADDVRIKVSAKNVVDTEVLTLNEDGTVASYANQGAARDSWSAYVEGTWRRDDDKYVLNLTYDADANYTFDIEYQDMATNVAADYTPDRFTVDKTAPTDLTVSYSTHVYEEILESITFGYYNAQMTVTITAVDETSGIYHIAYSYINSEGVSGVNAELLDQAIQSAEITHEGNKATATFTIPKLALTNDTQFNGTVEFTAYDRSERSTEKADTKRIVVDNISPTSTVTYSAAVQEANGISYHDGDITATIVINEANFDSGDVNVTVTKDDGNYPVNVNWTNNSVDTHTGTFTLTEDGDYIVSVQYRDKSGNQMNTYTSNQLTLDTTAPTIQVSNIVANSANKDSEYGFDITFDDINIDVDSMNPVLLAVVQNENGVYITTQIDLGDSVVAVAGQTYTYTVENLTEDALYTLSYEVMDMSGNVTNTAVLEDGEEYGEVQFSINRNGSVFGFGDDYVEYLVDQYYVYDVYDDVIIVEVNVDPIEDYVVLLNGEELTEGVDYTTEQTSNNGEWSKRTYIINKDLFADEGEYSIIVSSTDKAESTAYSDVKNLAISFVVDKTAPVITISGLANDGRYQTDEQTVTLIPSDEGGRLNSLRVVVLDSNGKPLTDENGSDISVRFEMSGDELLTYLEENDGKVVFTVPEGLNNQVHIICNDCAVNANSETNEYNKIFTKVTVSQSQLVIFYANKPLFYGTIAGVLALIALIVIVVKRKKDKDEEKKQMQKAKV